MFTPRWKKRAKVTHGNINFQICLRYFLSFKGTVFVISSEPLSLKSLPSLQWYPLHIFTINNMKIIVVFLHIILKQKGVFSTHYSQAEGRIFCTLFSWRKAYFRLIKNPKLKIIKFQRENDWIDIFCILDETKCLRVL